MCGHMIFGVLFVNNVSDLDSDAIPPPSRSLHGDSPSQWLLFGLCAFLQDPFVVSNLGHTQRLKWKF